MNRTLSLTLVGLLSAFGCADDSSSGTQVADAAVPATSTPSSDAAVNSDAAVTSASDAATTGSAKIPLLVWVDDLVDNHTRDDAVPDTVDDKNIADNQDPSAFDARFK